MPSRPVLTAAVVATVLLAGCGAGPSEQTTAGPTTPAGTAPGTAAPETTATLQEVDVEAAAVKQEVLAAIESAETYELNATIERSQSANGVTQTATVESSGVFDRAARELHIEQTTRSAGNTVSVATYVVNRTLYQESERFVRAYASRWVRLPVENFSRQWRMLDTLTRQRVVLGNATVSVLGARTAGDTRAYVLDLDVDEGAYNRVLESRLDRSGANATVDVGEASFRYVVAADSGRLLQSSGTVKSTLTAGGQTTELTERITLRFGGYGEPVSVTLPETADTAVEPGDQSTTAA